MMSYLWIFVLASLAFGAKAEDNGDAVEESPVPTAAPVPAAPDAPEEPTGDAGGEMDLADAVNPVPTEQPAKPTEAPPKKDEPAGDGFDLNDAIGTVAPAEPGPEPVPEKPAVDPPKDDGNAGGSLSDSDLLDIDGNGNDNNPEGGKARAAGPAPGSNDGPAADETQEAGAGKIAGIIMGVGAAIIGAVTSYIAYQKKKLCFKIQGGDPESANKESGAQSDPQVMSNLLKSS